jgi:flagellar protein FlbT
MALLQTTSQKPAQRLSKTLSETLSEKKPSLLFIDLKPGERCILDGAVIVNPKQVSIRFAVENAPKVCVLRGNMVMTVEKADTPCKKLYFTIQLIYIDHENKDIHHREYKRQIAAIEKAAPSLKKEIDDVKKYIHDGVYYRALLKTSDLIKAEAHLIAPLVPESNDQSLENN